MKFIKIKTRKFLPPKDEIWNQLEKIKIKDKDLLVITSKVLAIHQGRTVKIDPAVNKMDLIKKEAEYSLWSRHAKSGRKFLMTIKGNTFLSSAGIDESNANGYYVLWPNHINQELKKIHQFLLRKHNIKNLGLISTDTRSLPLRRGSLGVSIGTYGFETLKDYRGTPDIFGRKLKYSVVNSADALAAVAVYIMGEGGEQTPMLIIRNSGVKFTARNAFEDLTVPLSKDLYYPILKVFKKR